MASKTRVEKRQARRQRLKARLHGTASRPRLAVFRSNRHLYAQLIDDDKGITLAAANDREVKTGGATAIGAAVAKKALARGITRVVFDRGGYHYTGAIEKLATGARHGGLLF